MNPTTVAVDLAKSVFQLAVADASWRVIETHRLTPDIRLQVFPKQPIYRSASCR